MVLHRIFSLAGALQLCLTAAQEAPEAAPTAIRVSCTDEMNHLRRQAGFSDFKDKEILDLRLSATPEESTRDESAPALTFVHSVCNSLQAASDDEAHPFTADLTYAVHRQNGEEADCSAAVEYWKEALNELKPLPPAYEDNNTNIYKHSKNVSFVALFNPEANASVDCAYITCPRKSNTNPPPEDTDEDGTEGDLDGKEEEKDKGDEEEEDAGLGGPSPGEMDDHSPAAGVDALSPHEGSERGVETSEVDMPDKQSQIERRRLSASFRTAATIPAEESRLLLCATEPAALKKDKRPFTEAQFQKITEALSNSSPLTALSTLSILAAAFIAVVAF